MSRASIPVARRAFLAGTGASLALRPVWGAQKTHAPAGGSAGPELWYDKPAGLWVEALPIGNGRLGAMVFGRIVQERIQLNEETLWAGSPYEPDNPDALAALPEVRRLIDQGEFKKAQDLISQSMMAKPLSQMPYGAVGDVFLNFTDGEPVTQYRRSLDLGGAIARTVFRTAKGAHEREVFASGPDRVIVVRLVARGAARLNFDIAYRPPGPANYGTPGYQGASKPLATVPVNWDFREPIERENRPADLKIQADGTSALLVTGRNIESSGIPAGLSYALRIAARGDGRIAVEGEGLTVRGARAVTVVMAAATSFVSFVRTDGDPISPVRLQTSAAHRKRYPQLRAAHVAAHQNLFDRFSISLGAPSPRASDPTDMRIARAEEDTAGLAALYVQYARYLMISSSRGTGQPANLQGMWNEGINPPWGSKYTININTEMNYWPVDAANLSECYEPLLRMVEELSITGARTAKAMYGARGWVAHHNTDLWRASAPIDGPLWGMWPMGGAWLCNTLWDHYDYVRDPALLARLYPLLKGASLFFVDVLVEDPKGRGLVTSPSLSPENSHHPETNICAGPAMDRQILRDLFAHSLEAHKLQNDPDAEFAATILDRRARLPKDRIGAQGQLQEWLEDWDAGAPEQHHRHVSHLYGVYPSGQINVRDTPELVAAAKVTLNTRGDLSTGWATAWRLALWARMGDGERAHGILKGLLGPERTYPNMFDAHPPFQIDGNFGGTAGILEMVVQSWGGEILLLPALPADWREGHVAGLRVRGDGTLALNWRDGALQSLSIKGSPNTEFAVRYRGELRVLRLDNSGTANWA
jgi:alpha-L-fucosidase 2